MRQSKEWFRDGSQTTNEVLDHYDDWSKSYDETIKSWNYKAPEIGAELHKKYTTLEGTICDAGCGTGMTGEALKEAGFADIIGFDLSPESLEISRDKNVYSSLQALDMHKQPFAFIDDQFAAVNCLGVLTYLDDVPSVLREFARITKPGGMVIFSHRDDMVAEPQFQKDFEAIEKDKVWEKVFVSDPEPYLPGNEDFSDKIKVIYYAYRVL